MKTAGIVTYWHSSSNYGTILQNYAVQKVLKDNDIQGITIRYRVNIKMSLKEKIEQSIKCYGLIKTILSVFKRKMLYLYQKKNSINDVNRNFESFIDKWISRTDRIFTSVDDIKNNLPKKDLYIAGSDQIWNVNDFLLFYAQKEIAVAFLEFCPENSKKISFAASFGPTTAESPYKAILSCDLKKLDFISVREESGITICKDLGVKNVVHHLDPTFMLSRNEYRQLIDDRVKRRRKKYILLYLLNDATDFSIRKLKKWAQKQNLELVYVNGNTDRIKINFYKKTYATIPEWLYLIDNAEYVFTNSFHGVAFSIIFNKKFLYLDQKKFFHNHNPRIKSLFETLSLQERIYQNNFEKIKNDIPYEEIDKFLENYRKHSSFVQFLNKIF